MDIEFSNSLSKRVGRVVFQGFKGFFQNMTLAFVVQDRSFFETTLLIPSLSPFFTTCQLITNQPDGHGLRYVAGLSDDNLLGEWSLQQVH